MSPEIWVLGALIALALAQVAVVLYARGIPDSRGGSDAEGAATQPEGGGSGEDGAVECRHCGTENERSYRFCRECVSELPGSSVGSGSVPSPGGRRMF